MGNYGVIKEALLVKYNTSTSEYDVVQKLVTATVNGVMILANGDGFEYNGRRVSVSSVYHGGAFGFSEMSGGAFSLYEMSGGDITVTLNIPGYGVKVFAGKARVQDVNGVGRGVLCKPRQSDPTATYTHLCLVVESPGSVFTEN